jgi:hypothetical protein
MAFVRATVSRRDEAVVSGGEGLTDIPERGAQRRDLLHDIDTVAVLF